MITSVFRFRAGDAVPVDPEVIMEAAPWHDRERTLHALKDEVLAESTTDLGAFLWIKIANPTPAEMALLADMYSFPELQLEDATNPRQRAKLETGTERGFVVLKELRYDDERSAVETGQVAVFIGPSYVVSIRHGDAAPGSARARVEQRRELLSHGPTAVLHAICDVIVDEYLEIVDHLLNDIEEIEELVFSDSRDYHAELIYNLKRENLEVKRAVAPLWNAARMLSGQTHPDMRAAMAPYFRDVGDHILRANDLVESNDQLLMTMLMAATSQQDLQQNRDMRKISAWAAIIAVPTAIAGIYGMNFEHMPELSWVFGYPTVLAIMASVCLVLHRRFKRSSWL